MSRLLITVCTYNELENIRQLIPDLRAVAPHADILVIDDNSPDGTSDAVKAIRSADSQVLLLTRSGKLGLGTAMLSGFHYGIEHGYDLLINLDADFSHHPRYIPDLLTSIAFCDVAIGSRYVEGGGAVNWNWHRRLISRSINLYARCLLGLRTRDNSGSFRCYRIAKLAEIDWACVISTGYVFLEEVLYRCRSVGCKFDEVPIMFEDRRHGVTKIDWKEAVAAVFTILWLAGHRIRRVPVRKVDSAALS